MKRVTIKKRNWIEEGISEDRIRGSFMGDGEEFEAAGPAQMPPSGGPMQFQGSPAAFGFAIMGEALMTLGILFVMLGVANFLTGLLGIKGAGEILVGIFLVIAGSIVMSKIRIQASVQRMPQHPPMMPQMPKPEEKSGSYR